MPEDALANLSAIDQGLGFDKDIQRRRQGFFSDREVGGAGNSEITFLGKKFVEGDGFAVDTSIDAMDEADNLSWISEARRQSDWVVFSLHCHAYSQRGAETAANNAEMEELADFARAFARRAIDAGVDVFGGKFAEDVLARTQDLSEFYGTKIDIRGGGGYLKL